MRIPSQAPRVVFVGRSAARARRLAGLFLLGGPLWAGSLQAQDLAADARLFTGQGLRTAAIAAGYVAAESALDDDGRVLATATEGSLVERSLSVFDVIYVDRSFDGRVATVGDTLLVYKRGRELDSPDSDASLGRIVYPTGLGVVTAVGNDVASVEIVRAFHPVLVGQQVQYLKPGPVALPEGERGTGEGRVVGLRDRSAIQEPFAIIFLDVPPGGGLQVGQPVALVRPAFQDGLALPEIEIGSALVLDVGATAATAAVTRLDRSDLTVGDSYRAVEPGS
jgi:hypothetical protein